MRIATTTALAAAALTLLAGCGGGDDGTTTATQAAASASPTASASASPTPSASPSVDTAELDQAGLKSTDLLGSRFSGDGTVKDAPRFAGAGRTFDYCGGAEPSVDTRQARVARGAEGTISGHDVQLIEEIVQYRDGSSAHSALLEFKAAVATCDGGSYDSFLGENGQLRFSPGASGSDSAGLPTPNYLQVSKLTGSGGSGYLATLVVQQGKYLTIGYLISEQEPEEDEGFALATVTKSVSRRVGALPS